MVNGLAYTPRVETILFIGVYMLTRDVHGNGKDRDPMGPTGLPWEWKYDEPWDGNGIKVCGKWELRRGSGKNHCILY